MTTPLALVPRPGPLAELAQLERADDARGNVPHGIRDPLTRELVCACCRGSTPASRQREANGYLDRIRGR
jgi:hypothetical protein